MRRREKPTVSLPADRSLPTCASLLTPDARFCQYLRACLSPPLACELPGQDPCQTSQPQGPQDLAKLLACGGTSSTVTEVRRAAAVPGPGARSPTTSAAAAWALLAAPSDQGLGSPAGAGAGPRGHRGVRAPQTELDGRGSKRAREQPPPGGSGPPFRRSSFWRFSNEGKTHTHAVSHKRRARSAGPLGTSSWPGWAAR